MKPPERKSSRKARAGGALLFVYGTLRSTSGHPMHRKLRAESGFVGAGTFRGRLYDLGTYPGAILSRSNGDRVRGEIYRLREPARTLSVLDAYEDRSFRRLKATVRRENGGRTRCWIYLYTQPVTRFRRIAGGNYMRRHG
ncbi:MAG TPA: gamma-glutamylcyclotransferase family protein [Candidatus Binatia bacterium]